MDYFGMILLLIAVYLMSKKRKSGWYFNIAGSASMITHFALFVPHVVWSVVILNAVFLLISAKGLWQWSGASDETNA